MPHYTGHFYYPLCTNMVHSGNRTPNMRAMTDYRQIVDSLSTAVILLNRNRDIQYLNESAEAFTRTSVKQVAGKSLSTLMEINDALEKALSAVFSRHIVVKLREHELLLLFKLQSKKVDCQLTPVFLPDTEIVILEIVESGASDTDYLGKDKQPTAHTVVRGLAHEIRNPLGGIKGAAQLLSGELKNKELMQYTDIIIREVDRLSSLVNQMQSPSKVKPEEAVNIHGILEHVRQLTEANLSKKIEIETDYDPSLPDIAGDSERLVQAILNIVQNAEESIGEAGKIILKTRIDHRPLGENLSHQQVVKVTISDNGVGIPPAIFDHIFAPMVTGKPGGSGLGLSITAEIIRQHDGVIDVRSEPGKTEFEVYLKIFRG